LANAASAPKYRGDGQEELMRSTLKPSDVGPFDAVALDRGHPDFEFDVPVRFDTDHMAVTIETVRLQRRQQIPAVEPRT
jgi:hypothetical protein